MQNMLYRKILKVAVFPYQYCVSYDATIHNIAYSKFIYILTFHLNLSSSILL